MTDLTEMVDWLRGVVTSDLEKAKAATPGPWQSTVHRDTDESAVCAGEPFDLGTTIALVDRPDSVHIATHDPRDTIARCEQELAIIDAYETVLRRSEENSREYRKLMRDPVANAERLPSVKSHGWELVGRGQALQFTLQSFAYGYRNRPGWKDSWKP